MNEGIQVTQACYPHAILKSYFGYPEQGPVDLDNFIFIYRCL